MRFLACTVTLRIPVHEDDGVDNKPVVGHVSRMLDALLLKTPMELVNGGDVPGLTSRVVTQPAVKLTALPAMTSFGTFSVEQSAAGVPADVGRKSSSTSIFPPETADGCLPYFAWFLHRICVASQSFSHVFEPSTSPSVRDWKIGVLPHKTCTALAQTKRSA